MRKLNRFVIWTSLFWTGASLGFVVISQNLDNFIAVAQSASPGARSALDKAAADKKAAPAPAAAPQNQTLALPPPEDMLVMVRSALVALDHANRTGNYSVLHALGGPLFKQSSPEKLAEMFAPLRNSGAGLLPVLLATPQLTETPALTQQGLLNMVGLFPTQPLQLRFQIVYQAHAGQWMLAGMNVGLVNVQAQAAQPPAAVADAKAPAKK